MEVKIFPAKITNMIFLHRGRSKWRTMREETTNMRANMVGRRFLVAWNEADTENWFGDNHSTAAAAILQQSRLFLEARGQ